MTATSWSWTALSSTSFTPRAIRPAMSSSIIGAHGSLLSAMFCLPGSIGRTDFPRGDHPTLINSITGKLWPLGDDMQFVPGHGPTSTFGAERKTNPFVADHITGYSGAKKQDANEVDQKLAKRWQ